jgi:hypothetical protein
VLVTLAIHCWSAGAGFSCDLSEFGPPAAVGAGAFVALSLIVAVLSLAEGVWFLATGRFPRFLPATRSPFQSPGAIRLMGLSALVLATGLAGMAWEFHVFGQGRYPGPLMSLFTVPIMLGLAIQGLAFLIDRQSRRRPAPKTQAPG